MLSSSDIWLPCGAKDLAKQQLASIIEVGDEMDKNGSPTGGLLHGQLHLDGLQTTIHEYRHP